ncbi:hypothetical protein BD779DRAFT_1496826 [Infundibulicybe gibba]|nr:hypothetical protein BD779DRAFT_1496826 [Infundibulicybe gibba]
MKWLTDIVPPPASRDSMSLRSFMQDIIPALLSYYATAILIILPGTFPIRLAFLPLSLWSIFRASTLVDLASEYDEDGLVYWNHGLVLAMTTAAMRVLIWTFRLKPLTRLKFSQTAPGTTVTFKCALVNAFDLCFNLRGIGWDWSEGLQLSRETRPTHKTSSFILSTFTSLIEHIIIFDLLHYLVQAFSPTTIGSPAGGSIFDPARAAIPRYFRSSSITLLSGLVVYCAIQIGYHIGTLHGVLYFGQHPTQWPPVFASPWYSTSLTEFWAKRWHQLFRDNFISLGGRVMSFFLGRVGAVLGAFFTSGILHYWGLWGMGNGSDFTCVVGFFLAMGVGVVLEGLWKKVTGCKVGGSIGWIWTLLWIISWGNILVDAWSRKGLIGSVFLPQWLRPSTYVFGPHS